MPKIITKHLQGNMLVLLAFSGLAILMTWPVTARLTTHLAGGRDDLWVHQWTFWWIREALREGFNPFFTSYLYFPEGVSLTSHNIAWFNIAVWLPLQAIFGRITAYNLVFLAVISLNGFSMYLFAKTVTRSRMGAFIAGLIFGFWPYTLSHFDHANMMVLFWVPLSLYALHHLFQRISKENSKIQWGWVLATAVCIAMIGITRWQLLIMSSPLLIAYTIYQLLKMKGNYSWRIFLQLLIAAGLALLIMAPLAAPLLIDQFASSYPDDVFLDEPKWGRTDLLAYFIPSIHNGVWRDTFSNIYANFVVNQFYTPFLGYTTILLIILGLIWQWKNTWVWLLLAIIYFSIALGPELAVNGREFFQIPMPYRLVEDFILLRLLRRPDRLNIFLSLPVAMISAWGMASLLSHIKLKTIRNIASGAFIFLILFSYSSIPFTTTEPSIPDWYQQAAEDGEIYAVLDLPINDRSYDKWYMQYQTIHGKPLATGHASRLPGEATAFLDTVPLLQDLPNRDQLPNFELAAVTEQLNLLHEEGIRYIVIHKNFANEGLQNVWRDWLTVYPVYEDDQLIVYSTQPQFGEDYTFAHLLSPDIGLLSLQYSPTKSNQAGSIAIDARWGTNNPPSDNYDVCFHLLISEGIAQQTKCIPIDPFTPTSEWKSNDVRHAIYYFPIEDDLEPGTYELAISLVDQDNPELVGDWVIIGDIVIHPNSPTQIVDANWQDKILLTGYDFSQEENTLNTVMYWQAPDTLDVSYKVFVHLVDKNTNEIIAQSDAVPRNWTYPTTMWQPGEIVRDTITLPIHGPIVNNYALHIGLYDEATGQRVLVESSESETVQEYLALDLKSP